MITRKRFIVDLLDDDNNNEIEQFIRKYGADEITGMTNGDVIKALFPDAKSKRNLASDILYFGRSQTMMRYTNEWWNAPYKAEDGISLRRLINGRMDNNTI